MALTAPAGTSCLLLFGGCSLMEKKMAWRHNINPSSSHIASPPTTGKRSLTPPAGYDLSDSPPQQLGKDQPRAARQTKEGGTDEREEEGGRGRVKVGIWRDERMVG